MAPDLFSGNRLPGLSKARDFLTKEKESDLICRIGAADLAPFSGSGNGRVKRRTRS